MTTIINNPDRGEGGSESHIALIFIVLVLLIGGVLLYMYGLPGRQTNEGMNINVPDTVDVNVRTPDTNTGGGGGAPEGGNQ
jgi:hypothetical protein